MGPLLYVVTVIGVAVPVSPATSVATAEIVCDPLLMDDVVKEYEYIFGEVGTVTAAPTLALSKRNCTEVKGFVPGMMLAVRI